MLIIIAIILNYIDYCYVLYQIINYRLFKIIIIILK